MSDYFGALMNLSGLGGSARAPVAPGNAPDAGGDIVESEVVREAAATMPAAEQSGPAPVVPPIASRAAPERAAPESAAEPVAVPAPVAADFPAAQPAAAPRIIATVPAPTAAAPIAAAPHHAIVRAALEWVASDPHAIADRRDIAQEEDIVALPAPADATTGLSRPGSAASARERSASPGIEEAEIVEVDTAPPTQAAHRLPVAAVETATRSASAPANAAPSARIVGEPAASGRVAPAADETVEISIGAIHVRVDAPVLQAAAAPAAPARMSSERSTASSALSRRALRRF
jgi:hypothetical protein